MDFTASHNPFKKQHIQRIASDDDDDQVQNQDYSDEVENQDDDDEVERQDDNDKNCVHNRRYVVPVKYAHGRSFVGNDELNLTRSFQGLKPFGMHKHTNMLLIRERISNKLKVCVPTSAIWKYVTSRWKPYPGDEIELKSVEIEKETFDLPKDDEWLQLIKEQKKILNATKDKA